ncbi:hypothetical protein B9Z19DRAFT_1162160 [Tuber borchii]|uniref:Uncharacterized protein n=1 Tax=Tuber borchii TaxID=42251 RepID=A0A2T6ZDZ1_TUBBO|nr:hypothetical protein B9Z19DRAFT_1162160 [Tuber borchii]
MTSRILGRNVYICSANDTSTVLGGLSLNDSITNANFYSMVEIVFIFDNDYTLCSENGTTVQRDDHLLKEGKYLINTAGSLQVNNEPWLFRVRAVGANAPPESFRDAVRERDYRCVITGEPAGGYYDWTGYEPTFIFPLTHEQHWVTHGYDKWITIPGSRGSITSVQNGMLLRSDIGTLFQNYILSINPDDDYKIVFFRRNNYGIASTHLNQTFRDDPARPVDQLLRWHFRQAVLANVRGQGEPCPDFSTPLPPHLIGVGEGGGR